METTPPDQNSSSVEESDTTAPSTAHDFHKNVSKRLNAMTDRQDSIQALSMWMIHHKSECQQIASCWLAAVKRAKIPRRLHLFYLANDVVQNCKKRNAKIFLLAFKNVLKDAVVLVRDESVANKIERLFAIWEERNTYFIDFINELRELLKDREKVTEHVSATNYKPQDVAEALSKVKMLETHVGMKQKQVANLKIDASKIEAVKQLKDRSHSHQFAKQFDDSYTKMHAYVKILENEIEQRTRLIELLENGQTFYEVQNDDAMVVANAYRNFGIRINNLKKRLAEYKNALPDEGDSPIPSPSAEAPSPGNTPPHDDDAEVDMEMSDTEENADKSTIIATEPYNRAGPSTSLTDRLAILGSHVPGAATDPRSKLPADKPAQNTSDNAISYLSSLISAKASQPATAARDKAVLKDLEKFAEKVKNPPPVSWSDYKRKQQEKMLAMAATSEATDKPTPSEFPRDQPADGPVHQNSGVGQPHLSPGPHPSAQAPTSPSAAETSRAASHLPLDEDSRPHANNSSPQQAIESGPESHPPQSEAFSPSQQTPPPRPSLSTLSAESQASHSSVDRKSSESAGWPPSDAAAPAIPPTPVNSTSSGSTPPARPPIPSHPPLRPPPMLTGMLRLRSPSPAVQMRRPGPDQVIRVSPAVVVRAPAPPPHADLSQQEQMDALDMLDSLHANAAQNVSVNDNYRPPPNSAVQFVPHQRAPRPGGQPIRTLGDRRNANTMRFPVQDAVQFDAAPHYPRKRPYQDYGQGYPYQDGGAGGYY